MCAIAGFFGEGDKNDLIRITNTLTHRGPDGDGFYFEKGIGLGHKRLKIIDLTTNATQPMSNEDNSIQVIFNGEIYNYQRLKKTLKHKHYFKSKTDTEIIIHLYEEVGTKVFSLLKGMFALAIYDKKKNTIILAKDRFGEKPLYYTFLNNTLIFASELKSILNFPGIKKDIDCEVLNKYLSYQYIPTPYSIFKGIKKLKAAHYLTYNGIDHTQKEYWKLNYNKASINFNQAKKDFLNLTNTAVKNQLIGDVPLGIFLSGGIDSSTITYFAKKNLPNQTIKTFSVGFKENSYDESNYAKKVATFLKTDHHSTMLDGKTALNFLPQIIKKLDEPLADSSIIPTYFLSKFAKDHVSIALSGDGADEMFCGYDTFPAHKIANIYEQIPQAIKKNFIEKFIKFLPVSHNNMSFDFKLKKFIAGIEGQKKYRDQRWLSAFTYSDKLSLLNTEMFRNFNDKNTFNDLDIFYNNKNNFFDQLIEQYTRMYLMNDILVKTDRASMFNSLEVRSPFLDHDLVNFVNSLPTEFKIKFLKGKFVFRKAMKGKLPNSILNRKKKGFGAPVSHWIMNDFKSIILEVLNKNELNKHNFFNYQFVNSLINNHFNKKQDNRLQIWTIFIFQLWYNEWIEKK